MVIDSKKALKKVLEINAEIYHFHDPELLPYGLKLKHLGKAVIFDSHEDVPNDIKHKKYLNPLIRGLLFLFYKIFEYVFIRKFDTAISVTPHIVDKLKKVNSNTIQITNYPIIDTKIEKGLLQAVEMSISMFNNKELMISVPDYNDKNVSIKVVKLIQSYVDIINRKVWGKEYTYNKKK